MLAILEEISTWINLNPVQTQVILTFVQTTGSLLLLIVTIIYVVFTGRLIHTPQKAYLIINLLVRGNGPHYTIKIQNLGPGVAKNVNVKIINPLIYRKIKVPGPIAMAVDQECNYWFKQPLFKKDYPIYISWCSVTGKKQKSMWIDIGDGLIENYVTLNFWERILFEIKFKINRVKFIIRFNRFKNTESQLDNDEESDD